MIQLCFLRSFLLAAITFVACPLTVLLADDLHPISAYLDATGQSIRIVRQGSDMPIVTVAAKANFRPYLHPIAAPDGKGFVTSFIIQAKITGNAWQSMYCGQLPMAMVCSGKRFTTCSTNQVTR